MTRKLLLLSILFLTVAGLVLFDKPPVESAEAGNDWSVCEPSGPQCGTDNGTQYKWVCPEGYDYDDGKCEKSYYDYQDRPFHWECPDGYSEHSGTCRKWSVWHYVYADKVKDYDDCPSGYSSNYGDHHQCRKWVTEETDKVKVYQDCHTGEVQYDSCEPDPTSTPEPTSTPTPEPTPTETLEYHSACRENACVVIEGKGSWACEVDEDCEEPEVLPTPTPELIRDPNDCEGEARCAGPASAPVCTDGTVLELPVNFFVVRNKDLAELKWVPTNGSQVNVFYKENGQSGWTHAIGDQPNNGYLLITYLDPNFGYTFALMQKNGCGSGELVQSVVIDPPANGKIFPFSFWQWSK